MYTFGNKGAIGEELLAPIQVKLSLRTQKYFRLSLLTAEAIPGNSSALKGYLNL